MTDRPRRRTPSLGVALLTFSSILLTGGVALRGTSGQAQPAAAAAKGDQAKADKPDKDAASGIPVRSELVRATCGTCHASDAQQRMTRISYRRATPEEWELTIKRMIGLNGLQLDPAKGREIIKYLADNHGLAPEEAAPAAFEAERRLEDFKFTGEKDIEDTCNRCHSVGRIMSERRTKEEWSLLIAMHRGYYPLVDTMGLRRMGPPSREPAANGAPADTRQPMDKVIDLLAKGFPLTTAEWANWSATKRTPKLAGRWALSGYEPGKGRVFGEVTIEGGANDAFTTSVRYTYAKSGQTVTRTGKSTVYTGFQWRGRQTGAAPGDGSLREVLFVDRNWREMKGRWFTGAYDELGMDVTLRRADGAPVLLGSASSALETGGTRTVKIYGANLPATLAAADIDLGPGLTVSKVVEAKPDTATLQVAVAADAAFGPRDIFLAGASLPSAFVVYDRIDAVKVTPQAGLARVGGVTIPKQLQQFQAVAYHRGADGKAGTADDIDLGLVDATWTMEEYAATLNDDDMSFVGTLDKATGLFTPNIEGPNPKRAGSRNNVGDVWVVAAVPAKDAKGQPTTIRSRAHLLVSVPLYLNWREKPEASQ
jgi:quinohemoprotein amine dehydrogenase